MAKKAIKRVAQQKKAVNAAADKEKKVVEEKKVEEEPKPEEKAEVAAEKKEEAEKEDEKAEEAAAANDEQPDEEKKDEDETNGAAAEEAAVGTPDQSMGESAEQSEAEKKNDRAESPLNILIGDEELMLNSGDEQENPEAPEKKEPEADASQTEAQADDREDKKDEAGTSGEEAADKAAEKDEKAEADPSKADDKNKNKSNQQGRSLWVTNLLPSTRAQELKHLLSRYGKVIGAKVVQSSRHPRTRCYGYVTMETRAAADHCIKKLNNTELKGQIIRVAKVRPEHSLPLKTLPESEDKSKTTPVKEEKKDEKGVEKKALSAEKKKDDKTPKKDPKERDLSRSSSRKDREVSEKGTSRPKDKKSEVLTFDKIREERDRHRARERERALREEEKRRRDIQRSREIERRQREEAQRLEREREKLRMERDRLDRQKQEILRLERERQKLEREKLEQEKQELRRQQIRLEEARSRPIKRPASTSTSNYRREAAGYPDDRKREAREDRHYEEAPQSLRFEVAAREPAREVPKKEIDKDYKHISYAKHSEEYKREFPSSERHYGSGHIVSNGSKYEGSSQYVGRDREIRDTRREVIAANIGVPKIPGETRYNERGSERSPVYRGVRDDRERRPISEHHAKAEIRSSDIRSSREGREHRYDPVSTIKESRSYREPNAWGGPSPSQPFGLGPGGSRDSWNKDNWRPMENAAGDRWVGNSSSRIMISGSGGVPPALYSAGNSSSLSCPPPPTLDRFDNYKSINNPRKY